MRVWQSGSIKGGGSRLMRVLIATRSVLSSDCLEAAQCSGRICWGIIRDAHGRRVKRGRDWDERIEMEEGERQRGLSGQVNVRWAARSSVDQKEQSEPRRVGPRQTWQMQTTTTAGKLGPGVSDVGFEGCRGEDDSQQRLDAVEAPSLMAFWKRSHSSLVGRSRWLIVQAQ